MSEPYKNSKIIILDLTGTKAKCIHRWNDMIRENLGNFLWLDQLMVISIFLDTDIDEAEEYGEDSATTVRRTLQAPSSTFMTRSFLFRNSDYHLHHSNFSGTISTKKNNNYTFNIS